MKTSKNSKNYKVRCTGFNAGERNFTKGKVYEVKDGAITSDKGFTYNRNGNEPDIIKWLKPWYNFEVVEEKNPEKIVITHDGKTTTATMYRGDMKHVGTAKCCPEDTFDFKYGAKLAMERMMKEVERYDKARSEEECEWRVVNRPVKKGDYIRLTACSFSFDRVGDILKVNSASYGDAFVLAKDHPNPDATRNCDPNYAWTYLPCEFEVVEKAVTVDGFKVGDRVRHKVYGNEGVIICISVDVNDASIGVEFDTRFSYMCHNCKGIELADGKTGTKGTSRWCRTKDLEHIEEVKEPKKVEKPEPKFKEGQFVKVISGKGHFFPVGQIVEIRKVNNNDLVCYGYCYGSKSNNIQFLGFDQVEALR